MAALAYYIFVIPLSYLPLWVLYRFSDLFYLILLSIFPYRKSVIEGNLKKSFPELSPKEIKRLRNKFYRHFCDLVIEGIKNMTISEAQLKKRLKVKNPEVMEHLYEKDKNVLLVSGHYNNWEWLISSQNFLFSHQAYGIGMPMTSKFWDKKVNQRRERFGMRVIHSKNYKEKLQESNDLKAVLVLSDQSPGDSLKSYWMNFLNQPTAVLFGAELMAHDMNFSVVFFNTQKIKRGYYEIELSLITEEPSKEPYGSITEQHTRSLETIIRNKPEFWLWSHKRWKRELPEDLDGLKKAQNEKFNRRFNY